MALEDIKDKRVVAAVKVLAYEMYDSYGDCWPVFWSTLDESQKAKLFRVAHEVVKAYNKAGDAYVD